MDAVTEDATVVTDDGAPVVDEDPTVVTTAEVVDEDTSKSVSAFDTKSAIAGLNNPDSGFYTSLKGADWETRKVIAKAMTNSLPLDDHIGKTVKLRNVIVIPVSLTNEETGEAQTAPRVLLIDVDNVAYHATSIGIMTAITSLFTAFGEPDAWEGPVEVQFAYGKTGKYKFHTLNVV